MSTITSPRPVTTPVRRLHRDTLRECALIVQRKARVLTPAEQQELDDISERQNARAHAADLAHDLATEAHTFASNPNPHDD